ncbi:unnamed protein product [Cylindrotheca closterium]|uniref:Phosducin thioredoxin-like domain-containing protein n=1 Tax=Cylindrotheca closterium TaxID=2856 RepID=A0AAD2G817_9STRA|nr:unnamed protein product [Cylindrotheca closterium]
MGRGGVIQYDSNKTSVPISTATSQFDDELMKRNIVTAEQVYLAKGAKSLDEAQRLANERREERKEQPSQVYDVSSKRNKDDDNDDKEYDDLLDDDDDDDDEIDDDPFFARYRQERLSQLKQESADEVAKKQSRQQQNINMPTQIQREEWTTRVNQASHQNWVLVILWDDSSMRTPDILQDLERLQREREHSDAHYTQDDDDDDNDDDDNSYSEEAGGGHGHKSSQQRIEIVYIEYQQANPHWPSTRVPAIFAYRNGTKQHEWVTHQAGRFPTREQLQIMLLEWGI